MAHLAFVAPPFLGHVNPMVALAREMSERGHRSTFIGVADLASVLPSREFDHRVVGPDTHPPGWLAEATSRFATLNGLLGLSAVVRDTASTTHMLCRELPDALRRLGVDMLVCDQVEPAGGLTCARLGLPLVSVASALPINSEPQVPPLFTPWRYDQSRWSRRRNVCGYHASEYVLRPMTEVIRSFATEWALGSWRRVDHCLSGLLQISQLVPGLDFPRTRLPPWFHYCGPLRTACNERWAPPDGDGRPLAFASLGSLQGSRSSLFRCIARAADEAGFRLILAHGGKLDRDAAARLPASTAVYDFVPQDRVLPATEIAILHGGLNTVMDAAAHGVPPVIVPLAFEQAAIARRVERAGFGIATSRHGLTVNRLVRRIRRVVSDPAFRAAAERLRAEVARAGGVRCAADLVERALATNTPVLGAKAVSPLCPV